MSIIYTNIMQTHAKDDINLLSFLMRARPIKANKLIPITTTGSQFLKNLEYRQFVEKQLCELLPGRNIKIVLECDENGQNAQLFIANLQGYDERIERLIRFEDALLFDWQIRVGKNDEYHLVKHIKAAPPHSPSCDASPLPQKRPRFRFKKRR